MAIPRELLGQDKLCTIPCIPPITRLHDLAGEDLDPASIYTYTIYSQPPLYLLRICILISYCEVYSEVFRGPVQGVLYIKVWRASSLRDASSLPAPFL